MKEDPRLQIILDRHGYSVDTITDRKMFARQIFMGASHPSDPEKDFTGQEMALVRHLVEKAFSLISGMQQNGGMGTEFDKNEQEQSQRKLEAIADNIRTALLGDEQEDPVGWLVFCDRNSEYDYKIYTCDIEATQAVEENNQNLRKGEEPFKVIPLYKKV